MPLIRSKLGNVRDRPGGSYTARCPACAVAGHDSTGNHLFVRSTGVFSCIVYSGDSPESKRHRQEIYRLAGDGKAPKKKPATAAPWGDVAPWWERYPPPD